MIRPRPAESPGAGEMGAPRMRASSVPTTKPDSPTAAGRRWERPFGDTSDDLGVFPALRVGLSSLTARRLLPFEVDSTAVNVIPAIDSTWTAPCPHLTGINGHQAEPAMPTTSACFVGRSGWFPTSSTMWTHYAAPTGPTPWALSEWAPPEGNNDRLPAGLISTASLGGWCLSRGGHPVVGPVAGGSAGDAGAC